MRQGGYLDMARWPMRNALEVLVGAPDEPVQLSLQRPWSPAARRRLRLRQRRWENLMEDDAEIKRGLEIASGVRGRDYLDEPEDAEDGDAPDETVYERVEVVLVRRPRRLFQAIANGSVAQEQRRLAASGPALFALARLALCRGAEAAWDCLRPTVLEPRCNATRALRAAIDAAATRGEGVELLGGMHDLGDDELHLMDGRARGVNTHVHVRGASDGAAATVVGRVVLGTPMPWPSPVRDWNTGFDTRGCAQLDPRHPWIRSPLLCNAAGTVRRAALQTQVALGSCVMAMGGMWRLEACRVESQHMLGKGCTATDDAVLELVGCSVSGGCGFGVLANRRATLVVDGGEVRGVVTGLAVLDDCAAFLGGLALRGCEAGVLVGGAAQVRMHGCVSEDNDCTLAVRTASCGGGVEETVNEYAEVELVGCRVKGRLWRDSEGYVLRVRNFVDVGNEYT